jgi:hypothetical protein
MRRCLGPFRSGLCLPMGRQMRADNRIGTAGATDFAHGLMGTTHLTKLDLRGAPLAALVHALCVEGRLRHVCLDMVLVAHCEAVRSGAASRGAAREPGARAQGRRCLQGMPSAPLG